MYKVLSHYAVKAGSPLYQELPLVAHMSSCHHPQSFARIIFSVINAWSDQKAHVVALNTSFKMK